MRSLRACLVITIVATVLCFATRAIVAQEASQATLTPSESQPQIPAPGHSVHGEAFNDGPRHHAYLMEGQGSVNFPVTVRSPEAQAFINQGVGQLHSFAYYEAERSFRQAAWLDPDCAMAYWGMAMANVNNPKRAREFLNEARKRENGMTPRERRYLEALAAFHAEAGDDKAKDKQRRQNQLLGLETIVQEFPDDVNAAAWLGMATWQAGDQDGIGSRQAVDTLIETVLQREPMHPGAHHYRIHLWDNAKRERAERSAATYAQTSPGIAHAWHMPGHIYSGLQRYADAAYHQEGSARVDHAYMNRDRVMPFEIHNYAHNNQWFCTSASHLGRVRDAVAVAKNLVDQPRDPQKNQSNDGGSAQRSGRIRWAEVLSRYELWDDLIEAMALGDLDWSEVPLEQVQKAYYLGLAFAGKGDLPKLREQIQALEKIKGDEPKGPLEELLGHESLAKGEVSPAFEHFARAPAMRPETLARAHLAARNYGFAESIANKAVETNGGQVSPLAALVEVLHAVGKDREAMEAYGRLNRLAKSADRDLPPLVRVAAITSQWKPEEVEAARSANPEPDESVAKIPVNRDDLSPLGPLLWSPFAAQPLAGNDTDGKAWDLRDLKTQGKNTLVLFYLGGKCAHCMQQLELFGKEQEALVRLNVQMIAVSTDDLETTRALKNNSEGVKFPMPILADPQLELFRRYQAFDDFEDQPLHGLFLIDAEGNVRFQRVSAAPFLEVEFIRAEAERVNRLIKKTSSSSTP